MLRPRGSAFVGAAHVGYASDEEELRIKVGELAKSRYGSSSQENLRRLFLSYDANKDGAIDRSELKELLSDADVGNWATRGAWVSGIFDKVDTNKDNKITWAEYRVAAGLPPEAPPTPAPAPASVPSGPPSPLGSLEDIAKGIGEKDSVDLEPGAPSSSLPIPASTSAAAASSGLGGLGLLGLAATAGLVLFFGLRR